MTPLGEAVFLGCDSNINNDLLQQLVVKGSPDIPENCSGLYQVGRRPLNSQAKANDWTCQDTLSPESLSSLPTGEYIKILPQSKQGKDDVIIGPQEIGDGRGQGSSEVRGRLDYKLGNLPPASSLKTQLYKSEGERENV